MEQRQTHPAAGNEKARLQEACDRVRSQARRARQQANVARTVGETSRAEARQLLASMGGAASPDGADPLTWRRQAPTPAAPLQPPR